ncbi:DUF4199 domain-containing protein [Flavitalea flava]
MEIQPAAPIKRRSYGLVFGLIAGLSIVILTTVLYRGGVKTFMGNGNYLSYVILIGLAVAAALAEKKANGGFIAFQSALKTCFTVFVIGLAAQTLFTELLLNYIDPVFKKAYTQAVLEKTEEVFRKFGLSEDKLDQTMAEQRGKDQFSFTSMIQGFSIWCIIHFIFALIIAAIVKKKKEVFPDRDYQAGTIQ